MAIDRQLEELKEAAWLGVQQRKEMDYYQAAIEKVAEQLKFHFPIIMQAMMTGNFQSVALVALTAIDYKKITDSRAAEAVAIERQQKASSIQTFNRDIN
jgi:hypothetical protein